MTAPSRLAPERLLRFLLRYVGTVTMLAFVAVLMPQAWMEATHRLLGMGDLPSAPVVGYLARSLSLFYALLGGLLWMCSFDMHRHRLVLAYVGAAFIFFGIVMCGVDWFQGMPGYWTLCEGPVVILFGILIWLLTARLKPVKPPVT
jgi:surface polysaccharide O-acyltransferase-like enzyme